MIASCTGHAERCCRYFCATFYCYLTDNYRSGGSSAINAMIYNKGAPADFDEWERLGATGWAYKDILPHVYNIHHKNPPNDDYI